MALYGLYVKDLEQADLVWFTTDESLRPGHYLRRHRGADHADVYIAESIAALILLAGAVIQQTEDLAKQSMDAPGISSEQKDRAEDNLTDGLISQLTESSLIWQSNPRWVRSLEPAPNDT